MNRLVYRWWPTASTFLVGWVLAAGTAWSVGYGIYNHDLRILTCFAVGLISGFPVGIITILVWLRRN